MKRSLLPWLAVGVAATGCRGTIYDPGTIDPEVEAACGRAPAPAPSAMVRLTAPQFRNTLATLFPFPIDPGSSYPSAPYHQEYTTTVAAGPIAYGDVEDLADTAESIALQAVGHLDQLLPCTPAGGEAACARAFIDDFAPRAFRRPLEGDERQELVALYDGVRGGAPPLNFDLGIAAVIAAVLQSPAFLYRLEEGAPAGAGLRRLTGYEIASRLSYLYWDAPPDAPLLARAAAGKLATRADVEIEAARLLDDPQARASAWRFFSEWLGFGDQIFETRVPSALAIDFSQEAQRFVLDVVFDTPGAPLGALLASDRTFVDGRLARHYGLDGAGAGSTDEWHAVTLPPELAAGLLGKAQLAAAHSPAGATSVVQRGKFVLERLLCHDLGTPPPGAQALSPTLADDASPRQRAAARDGMAVCSTCHRDLDDAGLGMEDLDDLGRARTRYASGAPVDAAGVLHALPDGPSFVGTAALAQLLAAEPAVGDCLARQWYRYAAAHQESDGEAACHVARMSKRFAASGFSLRELLLSVAGTDAFVYRAASP
jgi:hypothetical protein